MEMRITFAGGQRVDASFGGFTVHTDQSVKAGGGGEHPEPFAYFLSSLGTCAGIYTLVFCQKRGIPTEGIELLQKVDFDPKTHALTRVALEIRVPGSFPEKYRDAVARAAAACAVKKAIESPPELTVETVVV
jgi:putative redox protein